MSGEQQRERERVLLIEAGESMATSWVRAARLKLLEREAGDAIGLGRVRNAMLPGVTLPGRSSYRRSPTRLRTDTERARDDDGWATVRRSGEDARGRT